MRAQNEISTGSQRGSTNALSNMERKTADDSAQKNDPQESIPMSMLKAIVNPEVLSNVKAHLNKVSQQRNSLDAGLVEQSPAKLWEQRKKEQNERMLSRTQAGIVKAGWRVRQCLSSLPEGENANTFYLTCVKRGMLREVEAIFSVTKVDPRWAFNKNYKDENEKSALSIAIDCKNTAMMSKLLEHDVNLGMSIFHVISLDYLEGLKLLLTYNPCTDHEITEENNYFQIGMTPMLLAAHNNNYKMLSLLHEYGHRLMKTLEWSEGIHEAWESANERRIICKARAQPAYITLMTEVNHMDPMKYCLKEIKKMRKYKDQEHEFSTFYNELIRQLEDYMCSLLDLICSSEELAHLFEYEHQMYRPNDLSSMDATTNRWVLWNRFQLLEKASKEHLVQFVTHQQSQLALAHLRYRSMPFLRSQNILRRNLFSAFVGLLFPLLSLIYIIAPKSKLGCFIALPSISFSCHLVSDVVFSLLLLLNISLKNVNNYYLGATPTALEWLLFVWILGKWVQEFQECSNRGLKSYFHDYWNYNDIMTLTLFTVSIVLRASDVLMNRSKAHLHIPRSEWNSHEPRLLAEGVQAWAYVFVFLRILGIMRVDRNLGPLQISLAKMMADVLRFLCIFLLVICAFAFGLSELYWYYGTDDGARMLCKNVTDSASGQSSCTPQKNDVFSGMGRSFINLFWALFGLLDINELSLSGKHVFTEHIGRSLVAVYHAVSIIVMLNMLIAMMSKSYEDTSANEETEWKFHRTAMWIRFIRREVVRPPPMNLFPNPWRLKENFARLKDCLRRTCCRRHNPIESAYDQYGHRKKRHFPSQEGKYSELPDEERGTLDRGGIELQSMKKRNGKRDTVEVEVRDQSKRPMFGKHDPIANAHVSKTLTEAQTALRVKFRAKKNRAVLNKLVRRYKLKYLVYRKEESTIKS